MVFVQPVLVISRKRLSYILSCVKKKDTLDKEDFLFMKKKQKKLENLVLKNATKLWGFQKIL